MPLAVKDRYHVTNIDNLQEINLSFSPCELPVETEWMEEGILMEGMYTGIRNLMLDQGGFVFVFCVVFVFIFKIFF